MIWALYILCVGLLSAFFLKECEEPKLDHKENGGTLGMEGPYLLKKPKEPFKMGIYPINTNCIL